MIHPPKTFLFQEEVLYGHMVITTVQVTLTSLSRVGQRKKTGGLLYTMRMIILGCLNII